MLTLLLVIDENDVKIIIAFKKKQLNKANAERNQIEAELDTVARKLTKVEVAKTKEAQSGKSRVARFKNKRFARKLEKRMESSANAWTASTATKISHNYKNKEKPPIDETDQKVSKMQLFLLAKSEEKRLGHDK